MFVFGVVFLALFSAISYVLGNEDSRREPRPSDDQANFEWSGE